MNILRNIVVALCAAVLPMAAQATSPKPLVVSPDQVSGVTMELGHITLSGASAGEISFPTDKKIVVDLKPATLEEQAASALAAQSNVAPVVVLQPVELSATKGLVVYFARMSNVGAPTAVKVRGHIQNTNSSDYVDLGYAYLQFRGGSESLNHEFSDIIYYNAPKGSPSSAIFDQFELEVIKVSSGSEAKLGKFNLFQIDEGGSYPAGRIDPLHAANEYSAYFQDFNYKPGRGVLDSHNWYGPNMAYENVTEVPWGDDNIIEWNDVALELPTFKEQPNKPEIEPDGTEISTPGTQMPHVYEHTLYAMPGDIISLNPFYDLPTSDRYTGKYTHWYSYNPPENGALKPQDYGHLRNTGSNHDLLDFLIDPAGIVRTQNAGFFAGTDVPRMNLDDQTTSITDKKGVERNFYIIYNYTSLKAFADKVNAGLLEPSEMNAILAEDFDCGRKSVQIGTTDHPFRGKFNGNAHAIKNLGSALFGCIGAGAEIYDLQVLEANVNSGDTGIIVDRVSNSIDAANPAVEIRNIILTGKVTHSGADIYKGGVIGQVEDAKLDDDSYRVIQVTLDHVVFVGNVYTYNDKKNPGKINGALIGHLNNNKVIMKGCYVNANVEGTGTNSYKNAVGAAVIPANVIEEKQCSFIIQNFDVDTTIPI